MRVIFSSSVWICSPPSMKISKIFFSKIDRLAAMKRSFGRGPLPSKLAGCFFDAQIATSKISKSNKYYRLICLLMLDEAV